MSAKRFLLAVVTSWLVIVITHLNDPAAAGVAFAAGIWVALIGGGLWVVTAPNGS